MRTTDADILIVPGLSDSGPDHWQSRWEAKLSTARRVVMTDWFNPDLDAWVAQIVASVKGADRPVVLVAHSLGVWAVAHAAPHLPQGRVRGALLVAPPDSTTIRGLPAIDPRFADMDQVKPLPFKGLLVGSQSDPYAPLEAAQGLATHLGAEFVDAGDAGHINTDSGHGPWPEGLMRFAGFLRSL